MFKKKTAKHLQIFLFSLSFPLSPPVIPATPFLILLITNRGTKKSKLVLESYSGKGHVLYMDHFFTSEPLESSP